MSIVVILDCFICRKNSSPPLEGGGGVLVLEPVGDRGEVVDHHHVEPALLAGSAQGVAVFGFREVDEARAGFLILSGEDHEVVHPIALGEAGDHRAGPGQHPDSVTDVLKVHLPVHQQDLSGLRATEAADAAA